MCASVLFSFIVWVCGLDDECTAGTLKYSYAHRMHNDVRICVFRERELYQWLIFKQTNKKLLFI